MLPYDTTQEKKLTKTSRRKKIMKIGAEMNAIDKRLKISYKAKTDSLKIWTKSTISPTENPNEQQPE